MGNLSLKPLKNFKPRKGPVLLIIMDGIGVGPCDERNAVYKAHTPTLDKLMGSNLYTLLKAHGPAVGLPSDSDMGNSEVGHNALGAGRIFDQGAKLVNKSIETGRIFESELWHDLVKRASSGSTLHFIGLLSDGNVHSHIDHLFALLRKAVEMGARKIRVHVLADGRDVDERSVLKYLESLEKVLSELRDRGADAEVASGGGRMKVTMDRYMADWRIVERGWKAHVRGEGRPFKSAIEAVKTMYQEDPSITDQYLDAFVIVDDRGEPVGRIVDGDGVVFFNFRGDRAIEISMAFENDDFPYFDRGKKPDVLYAGMMEYDGDLKIPKNYLVSPPSIDRCVSEYLCAEGLTSFAIAETQKFGHVTYFWNGNRSGYINERLEKYVEIESDRIPFDQKPDMKAYEVAAEVMKLLKTGEYNWGRVNFANGDMVGHTGNFNAAVRAVETVDRCVSDLIDVVSSLDGICIVTADHGNADEMFEIKNGEKVVKTSHTLNPVPFSIVDKSWKGEYFMRESGFKGLSNVAATLCNLLGFEKPDDYDESLIVFS